MRYAKDIVDGFFGLENHMGQIFAALIGVILSLSLLILGNNEKNG